jgi:hypothetical protein
MRTLGRLSEGIPHGLATGFDSGSSLDHVYRNEARGRLLVGKLIDRGYLEAIGWRGVACADCICCGRSSGRRRTCGRRPGAVASPTSPPAWTLRRRRGGGVAGAPRSIVLRDSASSTWRRAGLLIAARQLADVARCEAGDAFDEAALAALTATPNLVIVSGLYELFSDNELVAAFAARAGAGGRHGGYLIYTGQPWHPQIELIARTLTSHRHHQAWVMRRRTQAELDELVRVAGFSEGRAVDRRLGNVHRLAGPPSEFALRQMPPIAGVSEARPWRRAIAWLLVLGPFFFASYGFATWVTAQRSRRRIHRLRLGTSRIPLLPWTIVPYWLVDLLYGLSLLLCTTRRQLDTHACSSARDTIDRRQLRSWCFRCAALSSAAT